jgi:hypothetical protein
MAKPLGIREAVKTAEDRALGLLDSMEDDSYWGQEFADEHDNPNDYAVMTVARKIVMNRIRTTRT